MLATITEFDLACSDRSIQFDFRGAKQKIRNAFPSRSCTHVARVTTNTTTPWLVQQLGIPRPRRSRTEKPLSKLQALPIPESSWTAHFVCLDGGLMVVSAEALSERKGVLELRRNIEAVRGTTNLPYRISPSNTNCDQLSEQGKTSRHRQRMRDIARWSRLTALPIAPLRGALRFRAGVRREPGRRVAVLRTLWHRTYCARRETSRRRL
jgi:hypothetical protein